MSRKKDPQSKEEHDFIASFEPEPIDLEAIIDGHEPKPVERPDPQPPGVANTPPAAPVEPAAPVNPDNEFDLNARPKLGEEEPPAKPGRPSTSAIREQLNAVNAQKKEIEDKLKAEQLEREQLAKVLEDERKARKEIEERVESDSRRAPSNIKDHPSVREIVAPWENSFHELCEELEDFGVTDAASKQEMVVQMAASYQSAKSMDDKDAASDLLAKIRDAAEREFGQEHAHRVMSIVRDGAKRLVLVRAKIEELQKNYPEVEYKTDLERFQAEVQSYSELDGDAFSPDPTLEKEDPYNPKVVLKNIIASAPEARKYADSAISFARSVMLPPPPINPADLAHLTPEQRREQIKARDSRREESKRHLAKILPEAIVARQLLPSLMERLHRLEGIVAGERQVTRGKPIVDEPAPIEDDEDDEDDITKFTPSNPEIEKFEREFMGRR